MYNGFKYHFQSESHQRQLVLASENPGSFFNFLYLDHNTISTHPDRNTNTTHLTHPLNDDNLPPWWEKSHLQNLVLITLIILRRRFNMIILSCQSKYP